MKLAELFRFSPRPNGSAPQAARKVIALCNHLLSERGEISGIRLAGEALAAYQNLDGAARDTFFDLLFQEFSPDPEAVGKAGDAYRSDPSAAHLAWLQRVVEPPRRELFRRLNMAPGGTQVLVEMRGRLLREKDRHADWEPIAADLAHLFAAWFNRGFLSLERIDWRTSALLLEKLIRYEAVHQIQGWGDLRRRLEADRRCYAFFHPALPGEPLNFIEVALTRGMSGQVQPLIDPQAPVVPPESADSAMFYSITNCQEGLRGVPFGSFLIKQVAEDLGREFPRLRRFATVSPIPGFREWLDHEAPAAALGLQEPNWHQDRDLCAELEPKLVSLCAHYLLHAKHGKEPLDRVARFHLRNGARLERIHWRGDTSAAGIARSAGLMANYVYQLSEVERNHERYTRDFKVTASNEVEALARRRGRDKPVHQALPAEARS